MNENDLKARKRELRAQIRGCIEALNAAQIQRKSAAIATNLFTTDWWREATWVFGFVTMFGEVETGAILQQAFKEDKQVAIPRIEGSEMFFYRYQGRTQDLIPSQFGILEPDPVWILIDPAKLIGENLLVVTPGLGFDRQKNRIGRGGGYYDRLLSSLAENSQLESRAIGIAYAEQLVDCVPVTAQDQPIDGLVTDHEIID